MSLSKTLGFRVRLQAAAVLAMLSELLLLLLWLLVQSKDRLRPLVAVVVEGFGWRLTTLELIFSTSAEALFDMCAVAVVVDVGCGSIFLALLASVSHK